MLFFDSSLFSFDCCKFDEWNWPRQFSIDLDADRPFCAAIYDWRDYLLPTYKQYSKLYLRDDLTKWWVSYCQQFMDRTWVENFHFGKEKQPNLFALTFILIFLFFLFNFDMYIDFYEINIHFPLFFIIIYLLIFFFSVYLSVSMCVCLVCF